MVFYVIAERKLTSPVQGASSLTRRRAVILQLRLFALYHMNKRVSTVIVASFLVAITTSGTLLGVLLDEVSGEE